MGFQHMFRACSNAICVFFATYSMMLTFDLGRMRKSVVWYAPNAYSDRDLRTPSRLLGLEPNSHVSCVLV